MTPAGEVLRDEISRNGPISFSKFMDTALYAPGIGYYTAERDPFGREGDFFTAAQVQPVFGRLIARAISALSPSRILDWGGGRAEMKTELASVAEYLLIGPHSHPPQPKSGTVIFANELFDALPVDVVERDECNVWREMSVDYKDDRFVWVRGELLEGEWPEYARRTAGVWPENIGISIELPVSYDRALKAMTSSAPDGTLIAIDYGYTSREVLRFPNGTLMSYRKHQALDDVLAEPGHRDITAHVHWTWLETVAARYAWRRESYQSLSSFLMRVGEADQFEAALAGAADKHMLQLKTLLFSMGESFQVMMLRREEKSA